MVQNYLKSGKISDLVAKKKLVCDKNPEIIVHDNNARGGRGETI